MANSRRRDIVNFLVTELKKINGDSSTFDDSYTYNFDLANNVFRALCHNDTHYFPMVNQNKENAYYKYVNAKHLMYQNCDWILEGRTNSSKIRPEYKVDDDRNNTHDFDMESITSFTHFYDEIHKTLLWLGLDDLEEEYVDTLRKKWIETYRIGF